MRNRKVVKRRDYKNKNKDHVLTESQIKQVTSLVRKVNPPELKYTVGYFQTGVSNVPNIYVLCNWPTQGVEGYGNAQLLDPTNGASRIGNAITIRNIQWKFCINLGDTLNYIRVVLFQFMDNNQVTAPVPGDIICDPLNNGYIQPLNPLNRHKIAVLYDELFHLSSGGLETIVRTMNIKPKSMDIRFTDNTSAGFTADIIKGNLYYLLVSDSGVVPHPLWTNNVRLCFSDS